MLAMSTLSKIIILWTIIFVTSGQYSSLCPELICIYYVGATLRIINAVNASHPDNIISIKEGDVNGIVPLCVQLVSGGEIDNAQQQNGLGRNVSLLFTTSEETAGIQHCIQL